MLVHDARRLWRAARAHPRQRRAARRMDLGLAFLDAEPGCHPATYRTAVTELGPVSREVELVLDLWADGEGGAAPCKVGHVGLRATTLPRQRTPVSIRTDFARIAQARWGGHAVACHLQAAGDAAGAQPRGDGPPQQDAGPLARTPLAGGGGQLRGPGTLFLVLRHQGQEVDRIEMRLPEPGTMRLSGGDA